MSLSLSLSPSSSSSPPFPSFAPLRMPMKATHQPLHSYQSIIGAPVVVPQRARDYCIVIDYRIPLPDRLLLEPHRLCAIEVIDSITFAANLSIIRPLIGRKISIVYWVWNARNSETRMLCGEKEVEGGKERPEYVRIYWVIWRKWKFLLK